MKWYLRYILFWMSYFLFSIIITYGIWIYLIQVFHPSTPKLFTWSDELVAIASVFTVLGFWIGFLAVFEYLGLFEKLRAIGGKIDPKLLIDGEKELMLQVKKEKLPFTAYINFSIKNDGNVPIEANCLNYTVVLPAGLFYGLGGGSPFPEPGVLQIPSHVELRGKIPIKIMPNSQPIRLFTANLRIKEKKEYKIQYYFYDNNNVYYPKTVRIGEFGLPVGKYAELKLKA